MSQKSFTISYPARHSGTDKSLINFIPGTPDLAALFFEGKEAEEKRRRFFVTDATVASLPCMQNFISKFDDGVCGKDNLLILGSGEPYKTIESVLTIVRAAFDANFTRKDIFIGIGGGVICDITAFAASIYKRGASVQFVPTTLLSMVDASLGGKTGCDFDNIKNVIGTFYPAEKLYFFPEFIKSLPENQYNSGLAEAFKTALLFDKDFHWERSSLHPTLAVYPPRDPILKYMSCPRPGPFVFETPPAPYNPRRRNDAGQDCRRRSGCSGA